MHRLLSGDEIAPGDEQEVVLSLPSGQRRRRFVSSAELASLETAGDDRGVSWRPLVRALAKGIPWILATLIVSILIPGFVRQWSDRKDAIAIQREAATDIGTATAKAVLAARLINGNETPERQAVSRLCSSQTTGEPDAACTAAKATSIKAEQAALNGARLDLSTSDGSVGPQLRSYIDPELDQRWRAFAASLTKYLKLSSDSCEAPTLVDSIATTISTTDRDTLVGEKQQNIDCRPDKGFAEPGIKYDRAFGRLGDQLILQGRDLSATVVDSHVRGFSTRWSDFVGDTLPVLLFVLGLGVMWIAAQVVLNWPTRHLQ